MRKIHKLSKRITAYDMHGLIVLWFRLFTVQGPGDRMLGLTRLLRDPILKTSHSKVPTMAF